MDHPDVQDLLASRPELKVELPGGLAFEGVDLARLAATHGTPCWVYGATTLRTRLARLQAALPEASIHYAVKANDHLAVLTVLAAGGAGADVVSAGELARALKADIPPAKIVFSGVGKSTEEMAAALDAGIGQLNVESQEELETLSRLAAARGQTAPVALRVNPDVDAGTHEKIATGRKGDKFGIPHDAILPLYAHAARLPGIRIQGLAVHIGSQLRSAAPFLAAYGVLANLVHAIRAQGLPITTLDCGGGIGIPYEPEPALLPEAWAGAIRTRLGQLGLHLAIEPGRWIAAPAGILLTRVLRRRSAGMARPILILDAAMNDLLRPAMYGAWHGIIPVAAHRLHAPRELADVAGPVCESSDFFARARLLPRLEEGDLVAILDAGAYGAVMSTTYNARPLAAQIMVQSGEAQSIRPRATVEALWSSETVPLFCAP